MRNRFFDVVILGAGPAGMLAAICLARAGKKVALLDRPAGQNKSLEYTKVGESVPAAINVFLQKLNLNLVDATIHRPIPGSDSLWAGEQLQQDSIQHSQGMGWRLDRIEFEKDLLRQAIQSGAELLPASLHNSHHDGTRWQLKIDTNECIESEFTVDASGRTAVLARKSGSMRIKGPPLVALWAVGQPAETYTAQTLTESQANGWWYGAHLPDGRPLAIFHTSARYAAELSHQPEKWWKQFSSTYLLQKKINSQTLHNAELKINEARTTSLQQPYGDYWAACGDAALSFDPLSSQGIFNALASAHMLSQAILNPDRQAAMQGYSEQLGKIADIYQLRRLQYYQRAYEFHGHEFWKEQLAGAHR